jgi:hypothetical protein
VFESLGIHRLPLRLAVAVVIVVALFGTSSLRPRRLTRQ